MYIVHRPVHHNCTLKCEHYVTLPCAHEVYNIAHYCKLTILELCDDTHSVAEDINYEDANVVRYVAGYVYRKVSAKIAKTPKTPNQLQLKKCLKELLQEEGESAATASANWLEAVDRGGLVHVSEGTYMLFCAMKEVVREYLHANKVHHTTEGFNSLGSVIK